MYFTQGGTQKIDCDYSVRNLIQRYVILGSEDGAYNVVVFEVTREFQLGGKT